MNKHVTLGSIVMTPAAQQTIAPARIEECLALHQRGNWGLSAKLDGDNNDEELKAGGRVMSSWQIDPTKPSDGCQNAFWIMTDGAASITGIITTVLLPDDY